VTVYALLVGIAEYDVLPLKGPVEDVLAVEEFLAVRAPGSVVKPLWNEQATRRAVVDGIREHLGRAGPGDVALFWFCGHGGEEAVDEAYWRIEPSAWQQTLVCADSRRSGPDGVRVADLLDKELGLLLDEVADRGPHVVAVLDSCHAGGATRDLPELPPGVAFRGLGPAPGRLPPEAFLPELVGYVPRDGSGHVLLAACRLEQRAREMLIGDEIRGVFTYALLGALRTLELTATYRELLGATCATVQSLTTGQSPTLLPAEAGPADQPFLGGAISRPAAFRLQRTRVGWEVDAGRCHGIPEPLSADPVLFAVPAPAAAADPGIRLLRVVSVSAGSSRVEPVGWTPDDRRTHPVVVARVPVPRCGLVVGGMPGDDRAAVELVRAAVGHAGPGGIPSPDVRLVDADEPVEGLRLRVTAPRIAGRPVLRILRPDGGPATADVEGHGPVAVAQVVARAGHIARWTNLLQLENPVSGLTGAVRIEVLEALDGEQLVPRGRPPTAPSGEGEIRLAYRHLAGRWVPPRVFVQLHNTADRPLWCVLLDLTDRYRAHASLFPGEFVTAGAVGPALRGRPIQVSIPDDRPTVPGASVRDWLKLVVTEEPITSLVFDLPELGEPATRGSAAGTGDLASITVDAPGGDWTTAVVPLVTVVPSATREHDRRGLRLTGQPG
jgi:hypothetical protein